MGLTFIEGRVKRKNEKEIDVKFLVDSGATYTLLGNEYWRTIELNT